MKIMTDDSIDVRSVINELNNSKFNITSGLTAYPMQKISVGPPSGPTKYIALAIRKCILVYAISPVRRGDVTPNFVVGCRDPVAIPHRDATGAFKRTSKRPAEIVVANYVYVSFISRYYIFRRRTRQC